MWRIGDGHVWEQGRAGPPPFSESESLSKTFGLAPAVADFPGRETFLGARRANGSQDRIFPAVKLQAYSTQDPIFTVRSDRSVKVRS